MWSEDLPDDTFTTLSFEGAMIILSPWGHVHIIVEHICLQCNTIHVRNHGCLNPNCETWPVLAIRWGGMCITWKKITVLDMISLNLEAK